MGDMEAIEREVRELLVECKSRRANTTTWCRDDNVGECLDALQHELLTVGIPYAFDASVRFERDAPATECCVRLANALWSLVRLHKRARLQADRLKEDNLRLQQNNAHLDNIAARLRSELQDADARLSRSSEASRRLHAELDDAKRRCAKSAEDLKRAAKRAAAKEDHLDKQLKRLDRDFADFRDKNRRSLGSFAPSTRHDDYVDDLEAREKNYKATIAKLQLTNRELLLELIALKETIVSDE